MPTAALLPPDWLLEEIGAHKLGLMRLSILALIESFVSAMDAALSRNVPMKDLAQSAAWTVMAAHSPSPEDLTWKRRVRLLRHDPGL